MPRGRGEVPSPVVLTRDPAFICCLWEGVGAHLSAALSTPELGANVGQT